MMKKKNLRAIGAAFCTAFLLTGIGAFPASAAQQFDPAYYAASYPDVAAVLGTDPQALLNHYLTCGIYEGRIPCEGAAPGESVEGMDSAAFENAGNPAGLVPMNQLANLSSLRKRTTDEELAQAYNIAVQVVTPYIGLDREEQLFGIASDLRTIFDNGMSYSMSNAHYNDPYGYFVLGTASCAGCTRATGLCLNILGIPYEHVNENQYSHQWCRVNLNGTYWICDAFGLYCGPEPAPYQHPYLQ